MLRQNETITHTHTYTHTCGRNIPLLCMKTWIKCCSNQHAMKSCIYKTILHTHKQNVREGKVSILGGHSNGHFKQESVYVYMCPILNGFRNRAISLQSTLYRRATRHVHTRDAMCIDVDSGIFENVLYCVNCTNKYQY
jgi:hypothetical protein